MAKMYAIAGEKFYIGTDPVSDPDDDLTNDDFSSVTWIEVKGWTQRGQFGDSYGSATSEQIGHPRVKKAKTTANAGLMENVFDRNSNDPGQQKLREALASFDNYPVRVVDKVRVGHSTPAEAKFIGLIMSSPRNSGGASDPDRISVSVDINSNIVDVAAT